MVEKMSLEQFRSIKARIVEIFTLDSNEVEDEEKVLAEYFALIKELLSYDLSDIPFEEWSGFDIWYNDTLDFSLTHANIDFSLFDNIHVPHFILKGCNVRGIDHIKYDKSSFDEDFIINNPDYFVPDDIKEDVKERYYQQRLTFIDLYNYPVLRKNITEYRFTGDLLSASPTKELIMKIGFNNAMRLFDENPKFVYLLSLDGNNDDFENDKRIYFGNSNGLDLEDYNAVKKYIYDAVIMYCNNYIKKHRFIDYDVFKQMSDIYPQYFIPEGTIPEEDLDKFYNGEASIFLVIRYKENLSGKDLDFITRNNHTCNDIRSLFGSIVTFLDNVPLEIIFEVSDYVSKNSYYLEQEEDLTYENIIRRALIQNKDNISSLRDLYTYSKYVPLGSLCNSELKQMIEIIGFDRLLTFNDQYNGLLDKTDMDKHNISNSTATFLAKEFLMSDYVNLEDAFNDTEKLYAIFSLIVENARRGKRISNTVTDSVKEAFPQEFIDYSLARELLKDYDKGQQDLIINQLENLIDSDGELLQFINKYPMLIEVVKRFDYSFTLDVFNHLRDEIGKDKLLEISTLYGGFLYNNLKRTGIDPQIIEIIKTSDDIESSMNEYINSYMDDEYSISFDLRLLPKSFKEAHQDLFLKESAPEELKDEYYSPSSHLTPKDLFEHPEWGNEVRHLDFARCLSKIFINASIFENEYDEFNLFTVLSKSFTNDEILEFIYKYGSFINEDILKGVTIYTRFSKDEQLSVLRNEIYKSLSMERVAYNESILPSEFRMEHSELFLDDNAPSELKDKFYSKNIGLLELKRHPEWKEYLKGKNFYACCSNSLSEVVGQCLKFNISNDDLINLVTKFDKYFDKQYINLIYTPTQKIDDPEKFFKNVIINSLRSRKKYDEESAYELFNEDAPDLFLDKNAPEELKKAFYSNNLTSKQLHNNPNWVNYLKGKNIFVAASHSSYNIIFKFHTYGMSDEQILYLMIKYGKYLTDDYINSSEITADWLDNLELHINESIVEHIIYLHKEYDEEAKNLIGHLRPELFLDDDAPDDLKECYYYHQGVDRLSFTLLKNNRKRWLPYLKNKELALVLSKNSYDHNFDKWVDFFARYGEEKALDMGMKNPDAIKWAIETDHLDIYEDWYERLGFVPHKVVLMDFPVERIDDFASSGKLWSQLMKIERHNVNDDLKSSMLKASMCFGVFNGDSEGFTKIIQLFSDIPRTLSSNDYLLINNYLNSLENKEEASEIATLLEKAYYTNGNTYRLRINQQDYKNEVKRLRIIMEDAKVPQVLSPKISHDLFGPFGMIYEPEFRDFLLDNLEVILTKRKDTIPYIGLIQKKWKEIKILNSNRVLTLDLALDYVKTNRYANVLVGNKYLENTIGNIGLTQEEFEILQKIYNFGKLRVASSIPRVYGNFNEYQYEVTRLDDPLPCAIGKLSNCCQELNNHAEVCMEHSMVSEDGRLFVIKDAEGNVEAQSWMWRNGNVLCFDNIEIPDKAFDRAKQDGKSNVVLANEIYKVYKKVADDLMEIDEKKYKELLLNGSITQEQYEQLVLAKVTVGLGNNDIASAIKDNSVVDKKVRRVIPFDPPVKLAREMYTSDSETQYILAGQIEVPESNLKNINVYTDDFIILDDNNIKELDVYALELLENSCKDNKYFGYINFEEDKNVVSKVVSYYGVEAVHPKIIKNANFAIIFEEKADKIIIIDMLFVDKVDLNGEEKDVTNVVKEQIRIALNQININNKTFDTNLLDGKAKTMYEAMFDIDPQVKEGGLSYGSK